tara:strand:+ start:164 stop:796 length:633 start_codon:yes stop_codon:yes gene_type:complete
MDDINLTAFYSIADIQLKGFSSLSEREMQRYSKNNGLKRIDRRYIFTGHQLTEMNEFYRSKADKKKMRQDLREELRLKKLEKENTFDAVVNSKIEGHNTEVYDKEINRLRKENEELRKKLSEEVPHQQKLKEAIQLITLEAMEQNVQHKIFSEEEYQDIIGTISEVDFQKEQVNYLRGRVEKQDVVLQKLVNQVSERNFIEAKSKGYDKK